MTSQTAESNHLWEDFASNPITYIEPGRLVDCFEGRLSEHVCTILHADQRVRSRLSGCIQSHYQLPAITRDDCYAKDLPIILAAAEALSEIIQRAGAIYWGNTIANAILAPDVAALEEWLGSEMSSLAITHRDLAGPEQSLKPYDTLYDRIYQDGWHCFVAWCNNLQPAVSARMRLKFASDEVFADMDGGPYSERGIEIIRAAAIHEVDNAGGE